MRTAYPQSHHLMANLSEVPTQVRLVLENLSALPRLAHHIQVTLPRPWCPPAHVTLNQPQGD
jgi:hypothetical protein